MDYLKENSNASAAKIALVVGLSSRQVERIIAQLKSDGYLEREGSNKKGAWKVLKIN